MDKNEIRKHMQEKRNTISNERKEIACKKGFIRLFELIKNFQSILSYASFGSEFDMRAINQTLATEGRLILPKIEKNQLKIYRVSKLELCIKNAWGIWEPDPNKSPMVDELEIQTVFVPGICFDTLNHRLGYGKGFYDKLLPKLKNAQTLGIGYKEQLWEGVLPVETLDCRLDSVLLF